MKDKKDLILCSALLAAVLAIADIAYIRKLVNGSIFEMNGDNFSLVGMMQYVNPQDGKTVYFPIYKKQGDK